MSDLHKFLQDWLDAATGKFQKLTWYDGHWGLCACARFWDMKQSRRGAAAELQHRLKEEFGETCIYPFGGEDRFNRDINDGTAHLNEERLAWVRKVLAEKADPVWGAAIDVDGRPDWLKDTDICAINRGGAWFGQSTKCKAGHWNWRKDIKQIEQIKLLADHAYYAVQAHNKACGTSYTYWGGQGDTPCDWDGGCVLLRSGVTTTRSPWRWIYPTDGYAPAGDIIGYTRKTDDLKDFLTEWLDAATGKNEKPSWFSRVFGLCHCARLWGGSTGRNAYGPLSEKIWADFPEESAFPFGGGNRYFEDKAAEVAHKNPERLAWVRKTLGLTPPAEDTGDAYGALRGILDEAYNQSAKGKGLERHGNGKAWTEQPILAITRDTGIGFPTGQAIKKVTEAVGMLGRGEGDAAARELLGAIVYTAAAIHFIRE